jgi:hypothetical protein
MSDKNWVDKDHYRVTSEDGSKSWLYEASKDMFLGIDHCIEVADHHSDGTTDAYEYKPTLFGNDKGAKKND